MEQNEDNLNLYTAHLRCGRVVRVIVMTLREEYAND